LDFGGIFSGRASSIFSPVASGYELKNGLAGPKNLRAKTSNNLYTMYCVLSRPIFQRYQHSKLIHHPHITSWLDRWVGQSAHPQRGVVGGLAALFVLSIAVGIGTDNLWLIGAPFGFLLVWCTIVDFRWLFFPMLAGIPISTEVNLPGGLGTDFPSEPLMWTLTAASFLWLLRHPHQVDARFVRHPVSLWLLAHLGWTIVTTAAAEDVGVSIKFLLAKGWYVIVFYCLAGRILTKPEDLKRLLWWFLLPLLFTIFVILYRHSLVGFSFDGVNYVLAPFYRNHVMYACIIAVFLPFVWFGLWYYKRWSWAWWFLLGAIVLMVIGINFAYTRAAYVALLAAVGIYWLVRFKLLRAGLILGTLLIGLFVAFVTYRDNWLLFAPDYERTITHTRFESLLQATTRLEDISIMERVYRWVAASQMIQDKPYLGFGPGSFYFFYKDYTVSSFKTYVSDNPERSGMHNYYLMTAVEQGIPGAILFIGLCFMALLYGQRVYHQCRLAWHKRTVMSALLCFALIVMLMLMNDFVETDKIGSMFFICLALIVNVDLLNRDTDHSADVEI
jgi:O-antigen ligase